MEMESNIPLGCTLILIALFAQNTSLGKDKQNRQMETTSHSLFEWVLQQFVCLSVGLFYCLFFNLSVWLLDVFSVCLFVFCLFFYLSVSLFAFISKNRQMLMTVVLKNQKMKRNFMTERERENVCLNKRKRKRISVNELTKECENTEITKTIISAFVRANMRV